MRKIFFIALLVVLLVACGGTSQPTEQAPATEPPVQEPTATPIPSTNTPEPTPTLPPAPGDILYETDNFKDL